jgi:hypothetical protein
LGDRSVSSLSGGLIYFQTNKVVILWTYTSWKNKKGEKMKKKGSVTTDHEITSRLSKALPTTNDSPMKMNENRIRSKTDRSKLRALHEALQDPITVHEGI